MKIPDDNRCFQLTGVTSTTSLTTYPIEQLLVTINASTDGRSISIGKNVHKNLTRHLNHPTSLSPGGKNPS